MTYLAPNSPAQYPRSNTLGGGMNSIQKLEHKGIEVFDKKMPWKLPKSIRNSLGRVLWILAMAGGILQLWGVWSLWQIGHYVRWIVDSELTGSWHEPDLGFFFYLSVIVLLVEAVILLLASSKLKARKKEGWNWVFYALLINLGYGVVRLFTGFDGLGNLFWVLISTTIAAYFLFQVRDYFLEKRKG